jgi:predicted lipid-binding transport protein (Tim44 family)
MEKIDLLTLVLLIVAVVVILKLRSVLGRRTGDEEARLERYRAERRQQSAPASPPAADNVVTIPRRAPEQPAPAPVAEAAPPPDAEARVKDYPGLAADVRQGLLDIARVDATFDTETFIRGARQAYEMIVTAFAEGNRKLLRTLLGDGAYQDFDTAIKERESRGEQVDQSFVGISKADIVDSELTKDGRAHVTVRFVSQLISATRDKAGAVLSGDPQKIKEVTDIWTFQRNVSTPRARENPNWQLIATQAPA